MKLLVFYKYYLDEKFNMLVNHGIVYKCNQCLACLLLLLYFSFKIAMMGNSTNVYHKKF